MSHKISERTYFDRLSNAILYGEGGKVTRSIGLVFEAHLPGAGIGSLCTVCPNDDFNVESGVEAEVIGFNENRVILMPFEEVKGISKDSLVILKKREASFTVHRKLLGRVLDGRGHVIDGKEGFDPSVLRSGEERSIYQKPTDPLKRNLIERPLDLGVRSVNSLITCGKGQRVGIMAGSGVGKSVLLGMIARGTAADVNVIALIGERGREVREFIERDLGPEGLKNSIVIVATSDSSPLLRLRGAYLAATIAEYFRDLGKDVLFLMDSVTRFCMAQREVGLSMGEPPTSKGYPPSVFAILPKLLERSGTTQNKGSVTGLYTVLVEGDEMDDPIADSSRSLLDGHLVLSRKLSERGHFPAIDILQSASRLMVNVTDREHQECARAIREWISTFNEAEDLISLGAYVKGSNPKIDQSVAVQDRILRFLRQQIDEKVSYDQAVAEMKAIVRAGAAFLAGQSQESAPQTDNSGKSGMVL